MSEMQSRGRTSVQMLAEAGVLIALAKVLDMIVLFKGINGGSVTLAAMAPIFIFSIRWGVKWGVLAGAVFGLLQMLLGGYIVHPLQAILDYPLAFAMLGFCALPKGRGHHEFKYYIPSTLFAIFLRFVCHFLSGIIFYGSVDFTKGGASLMDALNPANLFNWGSISYSVTYNLGYLLPDALICLVVLALLWKPLNTLLIPQYKN